MAALPSDINFCYLAGHFVAAVIDGLDADDKPDGQSFGTLNVKVRALPKDLPVTHRGADLEIVLADIDTLTNEDSRITDSQGNPWIAFVAPSPSLAPKGSAAGEPWKVTVTVSGTGFPTRSKTFVPLPSTPEEPLEWTDIIEVAPSTPAELEALQQVLAEVAAGRAGAEAARDDAYTARDVAVAAAEAAAEGGDFDPSVTGWDIIPILGQSNALGRGVAIDTTYLDGSDSRVLQFANLSSQYADTVITAREPLFHEEFPGQTVGFALTFAKLYASTAPVTRRVLLVPCAHGNTGFGSTGDYTWRVGQAGPINLYALALAQIDKALAMPGNNRVAAILWHQGEANNNTPAASYRTDLDNLINGLRTRYGSNVPFILGQMSPVKIAQGPTTYGAIDAVHRDTPNRHAHTAFWEAVPFLEPDDLHFSAKGQRINGGTAFDAFALARTAAGGVAPAPAYPVPSQVTGLAGTASQTAVSLSWAAVPTATSYAVQYRQSGASTWTTGPTAAGTTANVTGLTQGTAYEFRVAASNGAGQGDWSTTLSKTTAAPTPGFTDSFARTNATSLGSTDDGKAWSTFSSSASASVWGTDGSAAGVKGGGARGIATVDALSADGTLTSTVATISTTISNSAAGIIIRGTDAANYVAVLFGQSVGVNRLQLVKRVAGAQGGALGTSAAGKVVTAGSVVSVEAVGSTITVRLNGEVVITATVTDFVGVTRHGMLGDVANTALTHDSVSFVAA